MALHSWSARVDDRTRGNGCPQCSGRAVCAHNCLATKAPSVAAQWDYEANDSTPDEVTAQSHQTAHWYCADCGCKWKAAPGARVSKNKIGCPQCARKAKKLTRQPTFAECQHPLLAEWDYQQNGIEGNFPDNTTLRSHQQIYWLCTKCPAGQQHSWSAMPDSRTGRGKTGCPFCAGKAACKCNSLQALYPEAAADWDHGRNQGQPSDYTAKSGHSVWWCSPQRGSWQQTVQSHTNSFLQRRRRRSAS